MEHPSDQEAKNLTGFSCFSGDLDCNPPYSRIIIIIGLLCSVQIILLHISSRVKANKMGIKYFEMSIFVKSVNVSLRVRSLAVAVRGDHS